MLSTCKWKIRGVPRIGKGKQRKGRYAIQSGVSSNNKRGVKKTNQVLKNKRQENKNVKGVLSACKSEISGVLSTGKWGDVLIRKSCIILIKYNERNN